MAGNGPGRGEWADERRSRSVRDEDLGFDRALEPGREDRGGGQGRSRAAGAGGSDQQGRAAALDVSPTGGSPTGPSHLQHLPHCAEPVPGQEVQVYVQEGLRGEFLVSCAQFSTVDVQDLGTSLPLRGGLSGPKCLTARTPSKDGLAPAFLPCLLGSWPRLTGVLFPCAVPCTADGHSCCQTARGTGARPASGQNAWHSHPHKAIVDWSRSADRNSRTPIRTCPHC